MATLSGTLNLKRSVLSEVVEDPNTTPIVVVSGTASSATGSSSAKVTDTSVGGAFRQYGNGNTRLILGSTTSKAQNFALIALTASQVAQVESLLGHTVCYRDTYGQKWFGAFIDMQKSAIPFTGLFNIGIALNSVTHSESV